MSEYPECSRCGKAREKHYGDGDLLCYLDEDVRFCPTAAPKPTSIWVLEGHYHEGGTPVLVRSYKLKANAERDLALMQEHGSDSKQWVLHEVAIVD